jgi:hypothetical protein
MYTRYIQKSCITKNNMRLRFFGPKSRPERRPAARATKHHKISLRLWLGAQWQLIRSAVKIQACNARCRCVISVGARRALDGKQSTCELPRNIFPTVVVGCCNQRERVIKNATMQNKINAVCRLRYQS